MASLFHILSDSKNVIQELTNTNAVKPLNNAINNLSLCAYPNANFSNFSPSGSFTQELLIPGGDLYYALMPLDTYAVAQYSFNGLGDLYSKAWSVPQSDGTTIAPQNTTYTSISEVANALSNVGGLLMEKGGDVLNS